MLSKVDIKNYIQSKSSEILEREGGTQERVLREIVAITFTKVSDLLDINWKLKPMNEISKEKIGAVNISVIEKSRFSEKSIKVSSNMNSKMKALLFLWEMVKDEGVLR